MSYATDQGVLNAQLNAAQEASLTEQARRAPHVLMRPRAFPDGNVWCALYGEDLQRGIAGFGKTPEAACAAFDEAWRTSSAPEEVRPAANDEAGDPDVRVTMSQRDFIDHTGGPDE